jgi:ubiquinone/menaquinone biosynthesis C-methylase UbiE
MADPFQDVDAAGEEFIATFAEAMDARQADPTMEAIVSDYLGALDFPDGSLTVEVGCGAGAVTRRIADRARPGRVIGFDPSRGFVREARSRAGGRPNLAFEAADGAALPLGAGTVDNLVLHTVLSHVPRPATLLGEAARVLRAGGRLVVCDADFSKASLAGMPDDPLDACARAFVREFVTDPHLVPKLRAFVAEAGFRVERFGVRSRTVTDSDQMLPWVEQTGKVMRERGDIGPDLQAALVAEYRRRADSGDLYGYQVLATLVAAKP